MVGTETEVQVYGHRGASATRPENTMDAFRQAVAEGADGIELDVRLSADDVPVVVHDARLGDGRLVRATPRSALPPALPTLDEVLAAGPWFVNIEIKNERDEPDHDPRQGLAASVVALIRSHRAVERVLVSSFDIVTVDRVRALAPELATAWLVWPRTAAAPAGEPAHHVDRAAAHGFQALHPDDAMVDAALVERAHDRGLAVNVWTVDDPDRLRQLAALGVDGVITNTPGPARAALGLGLGGAPAR